MHEHARKHDEIEVNGKAVRIRDPNPIGSQILSEAGYEPFDDHVLIQRAKLGSRVISLDQHVDPDDGTRFYAFRSGEIFRFTIDDHEFQWGRGQITEPEMREFADVPQDSILVLERGDDEPKLLGADDPIDLKADGTEHLRIESRLVHVYLDDNPQPFALVRGVYTTEQLLQLLHVPDGYLLNVARENRLDPLKPEQRTRIKEGMHFYSQVPGGASSH